MHSKLTIFIPLVIFLYFLYKWLLQKPATNKNFPPSPPKLPIIGNLHQLSKYPHRTFRTLSEKHGGLMFIHLGRAPVLIVSSATAAREIMRTHDITFSNRPTTKTSNKLLYDGKDVAGAQYGEYWRQMKSICVLQLLSNKMVRSFRSVREEEINLLVEKIKQAKGSPVNLSDMLMSYTNDVISRVALGRKYSGNERGIDFRKLLREFLELLGTFRIGDSVPSLAWIHWLDGSEKNVDRIAAEFDQFLEGVVQEHEDRRVDQKNIDSGSDETVMDFVDVLLDIQKDKTPGFAIDRRSIKALILDVFSGGSDTTYTVLDWAMAELFRHPKAMQQLQKEIREVTGDKQNVNEDDLEQMKYLKAVIKETLRLHPPIPLLVPRISAKDVKINGYDIPANTVVVINASAIHKDPAFWEEPEQFKPERFMNSSVDFRGQDFELIPFGGGRRICPGISFAIASNEIVLANLMHKFDWTLPDGANGEDLDMDECTGLTIHRKTPLLAQAIVHI